MCIIIDMMPSVEDALVLLVIPLLDYIVYPHLKRTMRITIRPIHKVSYKYRNSFCQINYLDLSRFWKLINIVPSDLFY